MRSVRLFVAKSDLLGALRVLGTNRRQRFSSRVPIWLRYDEATQELTLSEENATVQATVPASGAWPAAGATVNLFLFRTAVTNAPERVELHAGEAAILVLTSHGHVALDLLSFGPKLVRPAPAPKPKPPVDHHSDLPIFSHAPTPGREPLADAMNRLLLTGSCHAPLALRGADEVYQFEHRACMASCATIRISRRGDRIALLARVRAGFYPTTNLHKLLTMRDWKLLTAALERTSFWSMPERHERAGLDGHTWTIEGRTTNQNHRSECWVPSGMFAELGCLFVRLADIELPQDQP